MPIYKGNTKIVKLYKGSTQIVKRYKGTNLIYKADTRTLIKPTINVQYVGGGTNARVTFTNPSDPLGTMYYKRWEQGDSEPSTYNTTTNSSVVDQWTLSTPNNTVHAKAYVVNELGTSEITEI